MAHGPNRVRIMFINCPTLSTSAASYLLLAQNKFQSAMQFEVAHFWIYSYKSAPMDIKTKLLEKVIEKAQAIHWLTRRFETRLDLSRAPSFKNVFTHKDWHESVASSVDGYDAWFAQSNYNKFDSHAVPTIVVTESEIEGGYIGLSRDQLAIVSVANWKSFFKPGSALEYVLSSVQRYALRLCYGSIGSHYVTRGCIWDFDAHQADSRIAAFLGHLCSTCEGLLAQTMSLDKLDQVKTLISNDWIGRTDDPTSVASILSKNYKYELRRSSGLRSSLLTAISQSMRTEIGKFFFDIAKVSLAALVTLYIATHFPDWYKILRGK